MLRVIGAGFGRTGTYSLKTALQQLGAGPTYHMMEVLSHPEHVPLWEAAGDGKPVDWEKLFEGYTSALDWPASAFYRELMDVYPDAKVILTVRDPDRWYESGRNTIFPRDTPGLESDVSPEMQAHKAMARKLLWDGIFDGRITDPAYAMDVFTRHNQTVQERVPPERLLVYNVKEGWEPLCTFLGVPMPAGLEFPHLNDTVSFNQRRATNQET